MPKKLVKPRKRKLKLVKSSSRLRAWSEGEEEGTFVFKAKSPTQIRKEEVEDVGDDDKTNVVMYDTTEDGQWVNPILDNNWDVFWNTSCTPCKQNYQNFVNYVAKENTKHQLENRRVLNPKMWLVPVPALGDNRPIQAFNAHQKEMEKRWWNAWMQSIKYIYRGSQTYDASYTNKIDKNGKIIKQLTKEADIILWCKTQMFTDLANNFQKRFLPINRGNLVVWRSLNLSKQDKSTINNKSKLWYKIWCNNTLKDYAKKDENGRYYFEHPLPMSCSWAPDLAVSFPWQNTYCCVLKIIMPTNFPFISLSWPFTGAPGFFPEKNLKNFAQEIYDFSNTPQSQIDQSMSALNDSQGEVVLPPCRFNVESCNVSKTVVPRAPSLETNFLIMTVKPVLMNVEEQLSAWPQEVSEMLTTEFERQNFSCVKYLNYSFEQQTKTK